MNTPADWFDAIFIINLARRLDRWMEAMNEANLCQFQWAWEPVKTFRVEAYAGLLDHTGKPNGNLGCTNSHRAVLELIAFHQYERALVLEDDFMLRPAIAPDFPQLFDATVRELPADWRMFYLGGSYGENPKGRHSPHLIETNAVMTTSSYCVGWQQARRMAPQIYGVGPIDSLYHRFNREPGCFMASPRFFVQRPSYSDLTERMAENVTSMEDSAHEDMLLEGHWEVRPDGNLPGTFHGTVQRREISTVDQLNGTPVIVERQPYIVVSIRLPFHHPPRPWFKGESCLYVLRRP